MKSKLRMVAAFLLAAVMSFGLAACETEGTEGTQGEGGLVKLYRSTYAGDAVSLNPHDYSSASDSDMMGFIFSGLLRRDSRTNTWTYIGALAEDLPEVSEDGLVWTFKVKEGMQWSDGTPINAHSFEYSMRMLLDPKLANRNAYVHWDTIKLLNAEAYALGDLAEEEGFEKVTWEDVGCKALDDYTIQFTLAERCLPIIGIQVLGFIFPVHEALYEEGMNEDRTETTYGTKDFVNFPYYGAYRLVAFEQGQYMAYEKNPDFPLADILPMERYEYRFVTQQTVRDQLFENTEIDYLSVSSSNFDMYHEDPRVLKASGGQPWMVYVNMASETKPILQDKDFRQALFYGVDRAAVAEGVFKVYKPCAYFIKTDAFFGDAFTGETYSYRSTEVAQSIIPENDGYLPEKALELFNKAYEANGSEKITLTLTYFDNADYWKDMCQVIQETWMDLFGADRFEIILESKNFNAAYDSYKNADYELGVGSMTQSSTNVASSMLVWTSTWAGKNDQMFNEEFDELYKRSIDADDLLFAPDEERIAAIAEMEKILMDQVPAIPIFQNTNWVMYSDRVELISREYAPGIGFVIKDIAPMQATNLSSIISAE